MNATVYEQAVAAGVPTDSHYSDLYLQVTPESRQIIAGYSCRKSVQTFVSNIDGKLWYDVPFAFDQFWAKVAKKCAAAKA